MASFVAERHREDEDSYEQVHRPLTWIDRSVAARWKLPDGDRRMERSCALVRARPPDRRLHRSAGKRATARLVALDERQRHQGWHRQGYCLDEARRDWRSAEFRRQLDHAAD